MKLIYRTFRILIENSIFFSISLLASNLWDPIFEISMIVGLSLLYYLIIKRLGIIDIFKILSALSILIRLIIRIVLLILIVGFEFLLLMYHISGHLIAADTDIFFFAIIFILFIVNIFVSSKTKI